MIRKASLRELKQISDLYYTRMLKHFIDIREKPITQREFEKRLKSNFKKSKMFILGLNGIKSFTWFVKNGREYNLEEIFVTEENKGYGKLLMSYILKEAKKHKIKRINLDVHFRNKRAQDFFRKFGFSERTIEMSLDL